MRIVDHPAPLSLFHWRPGDQLSLLAELLADQLRIMTEIMASIPRVAITADNHVAIERLIEMAGYCFFKTTISLR